MTNTPGSPKPSFWDFLRSLFGGFTSPPAMVADTAASR